MSRQATRRNALVPGTVSPAHGHRRRSHLISNSKVPRRAIAVPNPMLLQPLAGCVIFSVTVQPHA